MIFAKSPVSIAPNTIHANLSYIEPGQSTARVPPTAAMSEAAFPLLKPSQRPKPRLGLNPTEIVLLAMKVGRDVVAHEAKESSDTEGFVAVSDDLEIDRVIVEENAEPCDDGVNGDHPQDTDNAAQRAISQHGNRTAQL